MIKGERAVSIEWLNHIETRIASGSVNLSEATFLSDGAKQTLAGLFGTMPFLITDVKVIASDPNRIVIEGRSSVFQLESARAIAVLETVNGQTEAAVQLLLPDEWTFPHSFQRLAGIMSLDGGELVLKPSALARFLFRSPSLIVSTYPYRHETLQFQVKPGLNFHAEVRALALHESLAVQEVEGLVMSGLVTDGSPQSVSQLRVKLPLEIQVGDFKLGEAYVQYANPLTIDADVHSADTDKPVAERMELSATVSWKDRIKLELSAQITPGALDWVTLSGSFDNLTLPGLAEIAQLIGDSQLVDQLPPQLRELGGVSILAAEVCFSPRSLDVFSVGFTVASSKTWPIVPGYLEVENVQLDIKAYHPFQPEQWDYSLEIAGKVNLAGVSIGLLAEFPEFSVQGWLWKDSKISLKQLLTAFHLPTDGLPDLTIQELNVYGDLDDGVFAFESEIANVFEISIGDKRLSFEKARLSVSLDASNEGDPHAAGTIAGEFALGGTAFWLEASNERNGGYWTFSGGTAEGTSVSLSQLAREWMPAGFSYPDELPDLVFSDILVTVTPETGAFVLKGTCESAWELPFGLGGFEVQKVEMTLSRSASAGSGDTYQRGKYSACFSLNGQGDVGFVEGLRLRDWQFSFDMKDESEWKANGSLGIRLLDYPDKLTLQASLSQDSAARRLSFAMKSESDLPIVSIGDIGSLAMREFSLNLCKPLHAEAERGEGVSLGGNSPYTWDVKAVGRLQLQLLARYDIGGELRLFKQFDEQTQTEKAGFAFTADNAQMDIPIPAAGQETAMHIALSSVALMKIKESSGQDSWCFDTRLAMWASGLPERLNPILKHLPERFQGHFRLSSRGLKIGIDSIVKDVELSLPPIQLQDIRIELGKLAFGAGNYTLEADSRKLSLSLELGIGLPSELNRLFGSDDEGNPRLELFHTYKPGDPSSLLKLKLGIDTDGGLALQPLTSPLKAIRFIQRPDGTTVCRCKLGRLDDNGQLLEGCNFGEFEFEIPSFRFDGTSFAAQGSFKQIQPLQIPTGMLKNLLQQKGLDHLNAFIPDRIPLNEINLFDEEQHFVAEKCFQHLERMTGVALPSKFKEAIDAISASVNGLPQSLKDYFHFEVPDELAFSIRVSGDGGASIRVHAGKELRFLLPAGIGPVPILVGVRLKDFTFGELLGGSLFLTEVNVTIDLFDLVTLAHSLLYAETSKRLPSASVKMLPDPTTVHRRIVIEDLTMLIVYQTLYPIPVPVFYSDIGVDYLGIEGLQLQAHLAFPKPAPNLLEAANLFKDLKGFFTNPDYFLEEGEWVQWQNTVKKEAKSAGMDLRLKIGPLYAQLPEYLGGSPLGLKESVEISLKNGMARLLNSLKKLSVNSVIQAIPFTYRKGSDVSISFGPLAFSASWLLATPQEFRDQGLAELSMTQEEIKPLLSVIGNSPDHAPDADEQGIVLFLQGSAAIGQLLTLNSQFALIGTSQGFATGFRFHGSAANVLDIDLSGRLIIEPKKPEGFQLSGAASFSIFDKSIFKGSFGLSNKRFGIEGNLDLFPGSTLLQCTGKLSGYISSDVLDLQGEASVRLGTTTVLAGKFEIGPAGLYLRTTLFNQSIELKAEGKDRAVTLTGSVDPFQLGDLKISGRDGNAKPLIYVEESVQGARIRISGKLELWGYSQDTELYITKDQISFSLNAQIMNWLTTNFEAKCRVSQENPLDLSKLEFELYGKVNFDDRLLEKEIKKIFTSVGIPSGLVDLVGDALRGIVPLPIVREAELRTRLSPSAGSALSLRLKIEWRGEWRELEVYLDLNDPIASVRQAFEMLLQPEYGYEVVSHTIPSAMTAGLSYPVAVTVRNKGSKRWSDGENGFKLGRREEDLSFGIDRVNLPEGVTVAWNEEHTFRFAMTAPAAPSRYEARLRMVCEHVTWIDPPLSVPVQVDSVYGYGAYMVTHTIPAAMTAGMNYPVSVTMMNTGSATWHAGDGGFKLGRQEGQPYFGMDRVNLPDGVTVAPGQSYTFEFALTAPAASDRYAVKLQMLHEYVQWFEPGFTVPVQVQPAAAYRAEMLSHTIPSTMTAGISYPVSVTVLNAGSDTWYAGDSGYKLGRKEGDPYFGMDRANLPDGVTVAPGQPYTFEFAMTAPTTPGRHAAKLHMLHEYVLWFDPGFIVPVRVLPVADYRAEILSHTLPAIMTAGLPYSVTVTVINAGTQVWQEGERGFRLGWGSRSMGPERATLPEGVTVAPGQRHSFEFTLQAPAEAGVHAWKCQMVHEGERWFGAEATVPVQVVPVTEYRSEILSHTIPRTMTAGMDYPVAVTVRNTGSITWYDGERGFKLGWGVRSMGPERVALPAGVAVSPGQPYTFEFTLRAPETIGRQAYKYQMVHEGQRWFGAESTAPVFVT